MTKKNASRIPLIINSPGLDIPGLVDQVNDRLRRVTPLASGVVAATPAANTVAGAVVFMQDIVLTSPSVNVASPALTGGPFWLLILEQDATGGRTVTFDPAFVSHTTLPNMLNGLPNTYSVLGFVLRSGRHLLVSISTGIPRT